MKKITGILLLLSISSISYADQYQHQEQYQRGGGYQHQEQYQSNQQKHHHGNKHDYKQHRYYDQGEYRYYIPYNNGYQRGGVSITAPGVQLNIR